MCRHPTLMTAALVLPVALPHVAAADEGGISFWLPGLYGSFAATPTEPGWSWATLYVHSAVDADADHAFPRGGRGRVSLGIDGRADIVAFGPTYTFETPLLRRPVVAQPAWPRRPQRSFRRRDAYQGEKKARRRFRRESDRHPHRVW